MENTANTTGFWVGAEVVTRRGKRGTVRELLPNGNLLVAFSPTHAGFEMQPGQLVTATSYDRAGKGYARQVWQ